jgi:hypothetical protein
MKLTIFFTLLFWFNSNSQLSYFIEYNGSIKKKLTDINQRRDLVIDNSIAVVVKKNKILFSAGIGREDWNLEYFHEKYSSNPIYFIYHCCTYKLTALIERQFLIPKTKLSVRLGAGGKFYFLNQMKDSYVLYHPNEGLVGTKPLALSNAIDNVQTPYNGVGLGEYSYITSVPFAVIGNLAFQYKFKKLGLKLYFEPYFMWINYKNAKYFARGSTFAFYSNLGLGINYPLNFKKKDQKVTGIE